MWVFLTAGVVPSVIGKHVKKGLSFDLNQSDQNGRKWYFTLSTDREEARQYVHKNKPMWIIGSPPCDQWSIMQNLNNRKREPEEINRKMIEARIHLAFCAELYKMQINGNRYYLHEHPTSASS